MRLLRLAALLLAAGCAFVPAADAQVLYWLDTNFAAPTLNRADADGNPLQTIALHAGTLPEGLALDAGGKLYWAEASWPSGRIQRTSPTFAAIAPIVAGGSPFRGVAIDLADQLLYWTSSNVIGGARVHRAALDGSDPTTLISLGLAANPRGIAVDHAGGKLYWADFNQDAIFRSNLDGSSAGVWITLPANSRPYGVAFDPVGQRIYWTEYAGKMRRAPTATGVMSTLFGGLANPTYLALDPAGNRLYWSEGGAAAGAQRIQRSDLDGGGVVTLPLPLTTYGGLAFQPNANVSAPEPGLPTVLALEPPSPNPNPNPGRGPVQIRFALPRETRVRLSVLDLQGREVAVLADGVVAAGRHQALWRTGLDRPAPAGMYFVRMVAEGRTHVRRVVLTQ